MQGLLKSQKNDLFEIIQKGKFNPSDFEWENIEDIRSRGITGVKYPTLFYQSGADYYFQILYDLTDQSFTCIYSPGENCPVYSERLGNWDSALIHFERWLNNLEDEISEPDFWNAISQEKDLIHAASEPSDDSHFLQEEQKHVSISLNEIKQYLFTSFKFNQTQKQFINVRIQYLDEAAQRLSKKDWKNIAIGTLMGLIVDLSLDPAKARELFRLAGNALAWLISPGQAGNLLH